MAAEVLIGRQVDGDAHGREHVARGIDPFAAVEGVAAFQAVQVIAVAHSLQLVDARVAHQVVAVARPDHALDRLVAVAFGVATEAETGREVDGDAGVGGGIVGRVEAVAAVERVAAAEAGQDLVLLVAGDRIVELAADDVVDIAQRVAGVVPGVARAHDPLEHVLDGAAVTAIHAEHDGDRPVPAGVGRGVVAAASDEEIVAGAGVEDVVAGGAEQSVVAVSAVEAHCSTPLQPRVAERHFQAGLSIAEGEFRRSSPGNARERAYRCR